MKNEQNVEKDEKGTFFVKNVEKLTPTIQQIRLKSPQKNFSKNKYTFITQELFSDHCTNKRKFISISLC